MKLRILNFARIDDRAILQQRSKFVTNFNAADSILADDLKDTLVETKGGVGLAAIQIGVPMRAICVDVRNGDGPSVYFNPRIIEFVGKPMLLEEGCLSFPGIFEKVRRHVDVVAEVFDQEGKPGIIDTRLLDPQKFSSLQRVIVAHVLQHETEHLDGVTMMDKVGFTGRERIKRKLVGVR